MAYRRSKGNLSAFLSHPLFSWLINCIKNKPWSQIDKAEDLYYIFNRTFAVIFYWHSVEVTGKYKKSMRYFTFLYFYCLFNVVFKRSNQFIHMQENRYCKSLLIWKLEEIISKERNSLDVFKFFFGRLVGFQKECVTSVLSGMLRL